jgi:hypothetical protein
MLTNLDSITTDRKDRPPPWGLALMIVSTTGIQTLGFSLTIASGFEFPGSLADFSRQKNSPASAGGG